MCTLYIVHCTVHINVHCTLYSVHTHMIKKGEIYQKPKTLIVWVGET